MYLSIGHNQRNMSFLHQYIPHELVFNINIMYQLRIFRTLINLLLSMLKSRKAEIILEYKRFSDSQEGNYKREDDNKLHTITIKINTPNVIIHECGHLLENVTKRDLAKQLVDSLKSDLFNLNRFPMMIRKLAMTLLVKELDLYKPKQHFSELFARFFEVFACTREVAPSSYNIPIEHMAPCFQQSIGACGEIYQEIENNGLICDAVRTFSQNTPLENKIAVNWVNKMGNNKSNKWSKKQNSIFNKNI